MSFPYRDYVPTKGLPGGPGWSPIPDHYSILTDGGPQVVYAVSQMLEG